MRRITRYTFKNPANEPKIKNIIKPKGFVPRYLSTKIPITVPTTIAATISIPIRKPKERPLFLLSLSWFDQIDLSKIRIITEANLNEELPDITYYQKDTYVNEIKYNLIEMNNFKKGEKIQIIFSNLPQSSIFDKTRNYFQNFDRGWGMFIIFFVILIIPLVILILRKEKKRIKN